ncbi:MAG: hypothetical protein ABIF77_04075 [bacterium]
MTERTHTESAASPLRRAVLVGLFTGTAVGVAYLLSGVPNVELVTLVCMLAGGVLGPGLGFVCGFLAILIYSVGNPYGLPSPAILLAQGLGMGFAGMLGHVAASVVLPHRRHGNLRTAALLSLLLGSLAVLLYDLLTTLAMLTFDLRLDLLIIGGIPFTLLHLATNAPLFLILFPLLLVRCAGLARQPLRGVSGGVGVVLLLVAASADGSESTAASDSLLISSATDSTATSETTRLDLPADPPPLASLGVEPVVDPWGERPLWEPFHATLATFLELESPWVSVRDGGLGGRQMLLHEAESSPTPTFYQDGIPFGCGHRWTDDPGLVPFAGLEVVQLSPGLSDDFGNGATVHLRQADPTPHTARTEVRGYRGPHDTFLQSIAFHGKRSPWRLHFDFEELLDENGKRFQVPTDPRSWDDELPGESKFRSSRAAVEHLQSAGPSWRVSTGRLRMHKSGLPVSNLDHEEVWGENASLRWWHRTGFGRLQTAVFWTAFDVEREYQRKLEMTREGAIFSLSGGPGLQRIFQARVGQWRLNDSGADTNWAGTAGGAVAGAGQEVVTQGSLPWRAAGVAGQLGVNCRWYRFGGWQLGGHWRVEAGGDTPWLHCQLESGGRAPRSDELLTADQVFVHNQALSLLPNRELRAEKVQRISGGVDRRLLGTDLALTGSWRWVRDGIGWCAAEGEDDSGRWGNDGELRAGTVRASVTRAGRFWGWLRLRGEMVWRHHDQLVGSTMYVPPEQSFVLNALWEHRFFQEDGILQIGYWLVSRGEMMDPWFPGDRYLLPAVTRHDLLFGFRLLGADLSMALVNVTDEQVQLTTGSLSDGREMRWRLHWTFSQ